VAEIRNPTAECRKNDEAGTRIEATRTAFGKGERRKVRIARRLRAETTMMLGWIAEGLGMGSATMVAHCLRQKR